MSLGLTLGFFLSLFFWLHQVLGAACKPLVAACGNSFPDQGANPGPLYLECQDLATGPPGVPGFLSFNPEQLTFPVSCLEECRGWRGRYRGVLRWKSLWRTCSFPHRQLRHSRRSASGTAWGHTSRGPFEISWEWDPSTHKHGRAHWRGAGSSPWVPGLSRGPPRSPDFYRLPSGGRQLSGPG